MPHLRRIHGRCVFFNENRLCAPYRLNLKLFGCKIWPFLVLHELKSDGREEAAEYGGEYYIYLIRMRARSALE